MNRFDYTPFHSRRGFLRQVALGAGGALLAGCSAAVSTALVSSELGGLLANAYSGAISDRFVTTVMRLLDEGVIDAARIDQSYQRVARLKGLA